MDEIRGKMKAGKFMLKTTALLVCIAFVLSQTGYAIPNVAKTRVPLRDAEELGRPYTAFGIAMGSALRPVASRQSMSDELANELRGVPHRAVDDYIATNIPEDLKNDPANINKDIYKLAEGQNAQAKVIPIKGLLKNTGSFVHIGLGQKYKVPVIYIDVELSGAEAYAVLQHELYEIAQWTAKFEELKAEGAVQNFAGMRNWIKQNYAQAKELNDTYHNKAPSINHLYAKYKDTISESTLENLISMYPQEEDITIAAFGRKPRKSEKRGGIPFAQYIDFMDLYRSETDRDIVDRFDISGVIMDPQKATALMQEFGKLRPKRLDTLIMRQSTETPYQSIVELISNALDATSKKKRPIGRFGVGGLQILSYLLDPANPGLEEGDTVILDTKPEDLREKAHRIIFFKGADGNIYFRMEESQRTEKGTAVSINWSKPKPRKFLDSMEEFLKNKFLLSTKMPIYLNNKLINKLDNYIYVDGGYVKYDNADERVDIAMSATGIQVKDSGEGMDLDKLLTTYLIPREGRGIPEEIPTLQELEEEVAFFYKAPHGDEHTRAKMQVKLQVSGVQIQSFEIEGYGLPEELVLEMPSLSRLNIARNEVEIDEVTLLAVEVFTGKLIAKTPLHQYALLNGFIATLKWLDSNNKKVNASRALLDTACQALLPWLNTQQGVILPNEEGFHEILTLEKTRYLDEALLVGLHPSKITGSKRLENETEFIPGSCIEAYRVPFREDSRKSYLILGDYLLINEAVYQKHKQWPVFFNLRLNFSIGYGRNDPPKGELVAIDEVKKRKQAILEEAKREDIAVKFNLDDYEADFPVINLLSPGQKSGLNLYINNSFRNEKDLREYLKRFCVWLEAIPDVLLNELNISEITAVKLQKFLTRPLPSKEFLEKFLYFYANKEKTRFFKRYISNLICERPALVGEKSFEGFVFLTFLTPSGTKWLTPDVLDEFNRVFSELEANKKTFDKRDLDMWEKFFVGVEKALPGIEKKDDFKRFLSRWLRLFSYDTESPDRFIELLNKRYKREAKPGAQKEKKYDYSKVKHAETFKEGLNLSHPHSIAVLSDGNWAVTNFGDNSISIINPNT
ncbi:MAG: hypothetical protein ABIH01_01280, partial [Candidatus Omnitrophota bacterium]